MVPLDPEYAETLGSPFISFIDLLMMNKHYNCTEKCTPDTSAKCKNDGFPNPRNCSECICPGGYGGPLCKDRPEGCGAILVAESDPLEFQDTVGNNRAGRKPREDFNMCHYWIKAPVGKKVVVELLSFSPYGIAVDGCIYGGVEFKWQEDQRLTGSRYCSTEDANTILTSTSNIMPIITYNRIYESITRIRDMNWLPADSQTVDLSDGMGESNETPDRYPTACAGKMELGDLNDVSLVPIRVGRFQDGWQGQFLPGTAEIIDTYNLPYDYGSIMQYGGIR
ncbi:unnamed protein product [Nippostrongylus brasiliensis]|uniref:CUB domain-containing protein n=1 Tax=Nippostrongylus brasiliensis TaxID=27835 RepID=A0A0N4Y7A3_NIPBR|nr:unnamed protein product [Nippostrongylus brasiliensis]